MKYTVYVWHPSGKLHLRGFATREEAETAARAKLGQVASYDMRNGLPGIPNEDDRYTRYEVVEDSQSPHDI